MHSSKRRIIQHRRLRLSFLLGTISAIISPLILYTDVIGHKLKFGFHYVRILICVPLKAVMHCCLVVFPSCCVQLTACVGRRDDELWCVIRGGESKAKS